MVYETWDPFNKRLIIYSRMNSWENSPGFFFYSNNPIKTQNWHLSYTNFVTWLCNEVQYCDLIRSSYHIWGNIFGESWVLFLLLLCSFMCVNNRMHYGPMVVFVCLHFTLPHYHQFAGLRIWRYWTSKIPVRYTVECVSKIKSIFHAICVFGLPIYLMMIMRICVLYLIIIIESESEYDPFSIIWG